jgi:predicted glycosyltransferase
MTTHPAGPRLLVYSQDGLGLGHQRRTTLLASAFLKGRPGASVLTVSDSPTGQFFSSSDGHDYLKLPSIQKMGPGDWRPVSLAMPFPDVLAMRREVIRVAVDGFCPDVLLVDHMPHGAMGELVPTLELLRRRGIRTVLGLRDILDAPATIRRRWRVEGAFEAVRQFYDEVLVYGSQSVFDVAAEYAWPADLSDRLHYCGYVCAPRTQASPEALRRDYLRDAPDSELVVAMAGGGADAHLLFKTLLHAVPALVRERRCVVLVVTGPFLPDAERAELQLLARNLPVRLVTTVDDSLSHMGAADLVVGMAGYNTTAEILSLPARALLVPREGPSAEQRMRVSRFGERGWIRWLAPESLTPEALAAAMVAALAAPARVVSEAPDLRGRESAARYLLSGLAHQPRPRSPAAVAVNGNRRPDAAESLLREGHG